jgi:hypothetical protein
MIQSDKTSGEVCQEILWDRHTKLDEIVLTPDALIFLWEWWYSNKPWLDYDRMSQIFALLQRNKIDLKKIYSAEWVLTNTAWSAIMRPTSYVIMTIPIGNTYKTIFVCNSYGNATFVVDGTYRNDDGTYNIAWLTKKLLQEHYWESCRVIFTPKDINGWISKIESKLFATDDTGTQLTEVFITSPTEPTISPDNIEQKLKKANFYISLLETKIDGQKQTLKEAVLWGTRQYKKRAEVYNQEKGTQIAKTLRTFLSAFCVWGEIKVGEKQGQINAFLENWTIAHLIIDTYLKNNEDIPQLELKQLISKKELIKLIEQSYVYDAEQYSKLLNTSIEGKTLMQAVLWGAEQYEKRAKAYNTGQEKGTQIAKTLRTFLSAFCVWGEIKVGEKQGQINAFLENWTIAHLIIDTYLKNNEDIPQLELKQLISKKELIKLIEQSYVYDAEQYSKLLNTSIEGKTLMQAVLWGAEQYEKRAEAYNTGREKDEQIPPRLLTFLWAFCVWWEIEVGEKQVRIKKFLTNWTIAKLIINAYQTKNEGKDVRERKLIDNDELVQLILQSKQTQKKEKEKI